MIKNIKQICDELITKFSEISDERKKILEKLAVYIQENKNKNLDINLVYVCTHNSRRSHFGQICAKVAASYFGINNVNTFSGGTETTAFNINAINALVNIGFNIVNVTEGENPIYHVFYDLEKEPIICFSKLYNDMVNPINHFVAIMTCGDAETNCPHILGVDVRIATTYYDPKDFDGTDKQNEMYKVRCLQIAMECLYVFSKVQK